ncbi:MAG: 16S rRNA (cytidine(1402)-2'-O)-methyltransferase [Gammaproteobacteria bacterium]|nr:16S rRNA (cytidine(1402)-2'-O)-methyltransferase [Gammaproteobacteria bacterium]
MDYCTENCTENGVLYVVATPIGNLCDISYRAVEILKQVDLIVVEDSRRSAKLLQHYNIKAKTYTLHDHNERENSTKLVKKLRFGASIAIISDAGTPLVSDPGYVLVNEAIHQQLKVVPIPGCCALIAALAVAGLPTDRFCFEGFLPAKSIARLNRLQQLVSEPRTMVFYEAPHRVLDTLRDMSVTFSEERPAVIARELTKTFETLRRDSLSTLAEWVSQDQNQQKGEIVLLVHGAPAGLHSDADLDRLLAILMQEMPLKKAANLASKITGVKKNQLYKKGLLLKLVQP